MQKEKVADRSRSSVFFYRGPLGSLASTAGLLLGFSGKFSYIILSYSSDKELHTVFVAGIGSALQDFSKKLGEGQGRPNLP